MLSAPERRRRLLPRGAEHWMNFLPGKIGLLSLPRFFSSQCCMLPVVFAILLLHPAFEALRWKLIIRCRLFSIF